MTTDLSGIVMWGALMLVFVLAFQRWSKHERPSLNWDESEEARIERETYVAWSSNRESHLRLIAGDDRPHWDESAFALDVEPRDVA